MTATVEGMSLKDFPICKEAPTYDGVFKDMDLICRTEKLLDAQHQDTSDEAYSSIMLPSNESSPLSSLHSTPELPPVSLLDNVPPIKLESNEVLDEKVAFSTPSKSGSKTHMIQSSKVSPYFSKCPSEKISCIPFPALDSSSFGLVQERLCHDSFQLLIAVLFLNKTRGTVSMPVFYNVIAHYPTPSHMACAKEEDLMPMILHLGLQNQRAKRCISIAKTWLENPPQKGVRYRRLHYPKKNDGRDIQTNSGPIDDDDPRVAWEVGHLPGIGAYAIDSWRIFCRDELRGLPTGLPNELTPEAIELEMKKEWTRVLPLDKELRAYLRWRWLRLGWQWDPLTGNRKEVSLEVMKQAKNGGVIYEGDQRWGLLHGKDSVNGAEWTSMVEYNHVIKGEGLGDESLKQAKVILSMGRSFFNKSTFSTESTYPTEAASSTAPVLATDPAWSRESASQTEPARPTNHILWTNPNFPTEPILEDDIVDESQCNRRPSKIVRLKLPRWRMSWSVD